MAQGKSGGRVRAGTGELVFESREQGTNLSTPITVPRGVASTMRKHDDRFCWTVLGTGHFFLKYPHWFTAHSSSHRGKKKPYFFILCYTGRRIGQKHREVVGYNSERTWLDPRCVPCLAWQSCIA